MSDIFSLEQIKELLLVVPQVISELNAEAWWLGGMAASGLFIRFALIPLIKAWHEDRKK